MDVSTLLYAGLFGLVMAGATFGACQWHFGRRLRGALARMEKLEQSRQTSMQHAQQSRKQVEALQKELVALREERSSGASAGSSSSSVARDKREAMEATLQQEAARRSSVRSSAQPLLADGFPATQIDAPPVPGNGFADTLPMSVRPRNLA